MKSMVIVFTVMALAAPVCAQAAGEVKKQGLTQAVAVAAQGVVAPPEGQDPDPYIVHG